MIIAAKKKNLIAGFIFMVDWLEIYKNNKELAFSTPDSDYFRNYKRKDTVKRRVYKRKQSMNVMLCPVIQKVKSML